MTHLATHDQPIVGGVDTHKEQHVAAVVDAHDRVLGIEFFAATRHGYKQMVAWLHTFGQIERIGVESTGSYGAGLLRYLNQAGLDVLEVTAPDKSERASGVRAIRLMPRVPLMRRLPESVRSRRRPVTA